MSRGTCVSPKQLERGRILVFVKGVSWHKAADMVGAKYEAFRRALDPVYRNRRNAMTRERLQALQALRPPPVAPMRVSGKRKLAEKMNRGPYKPRDKTLDLADPERLRRKAVASNEAFVLAMRGAIAKRQENPAIGTVVSPGTERPHFVKMPTLGFMSSPAALCAER